MRVYSINVWDGGLSNDVIRCVDKIMEMHSRKHHDCGVFSNAFPLFCACHNAIPHEQATEESRHDADLDEDDGEEGVVKEQEAENLGDACEQDEEVGVSVAEREVVGCDDVCQGVEGGGKGVEPEQGSDG